MFEHSKTHPIPGFWTALRRIVERWTEFLHASFLAGIVAVLCVMLMLSPWLLAAITFAEEHFAAFAGHLVPTVSLLALGTYGPAIVLGSVLGLCFSQRGERVAPWQRETPVAAALSGLGAGLIGALIILPVVLGGLWIVADSILELTESVLPGARAGVEGMLLVAESLLVSFGFEFSFASFLFLTLVYAVLQGVLTGLFAGLAVLAAPQDEVTEERKSWVGVLCATFGATAGFHLMLETESFLIVLPCLVVLPFLLRTVVPLHRGLLLGFLVALVGYFAIHQFFSFWLLARSVLAGGLAQFAAASILRSTARKTCDTAGRARGRAGSECAPVVLDGTR